MRTSIFESGKYTTTTGATIIDWVDDILLIGSAADIQSMHSAIQRCFTIKDLGNVKSLLSMLVERDRGRRIFYLSQRLYLDKVLKWFQTDECK